MPLKRPSEKRSLPEAKKKKLANKGNPLAVDKDDVLQASKKRGMNKENLLAAKAQVCVRIRCQIKQSSCLDNPGIYNGIPRVCNLYDN